MTQPSRNPFSSTGSFKEFLWLFFPVLLMTFSNCVFLMVEKLLLVRLSVQAMEAAVYATYACQVSQLPCVALAMMTQVCVGRWLGANEKKRIGPGVWQFIWFSFLSLIITIPFNLLYGKFYFQRADIHDLTMPYFHFLVCINFLYPLGATLSCFYLGQGKTRLILFGTIGSQILKLVLAYLLIFGWGWIPPLGLIGGALSTLIAQSSFCLLLFAVFLKATPYNTREWYFKPKIFWECIQPGLLRAFNRILTTSCWASIAQLMSSKGGDYLLTLSIGGILFLFLPFIGDAICQAQTTIVSNILGSKNYHLLNKAFRSCALLASLSIILIGIPLLIFPFKTFAFLFPNVSLDSTFIYRIFFGVWISFTFFTFGFVAISYILAFKDTKFSLFMGGVSWINGFLLMYFAIEVIHIHADQFWLVLSIMHATTALFYMLRMRWLKSQLKYSSDPALIKL